LIYAGNGALDDLSRDSQNNSDLILKDLLIESSHQ